jgi:hypothetical protein
MLTRQRRTERQHTSETTAVWPGGGFRTYRDAQVTYPNSMQLLRRLRVG